MSVNSEAAVRALHALAQADMNAIERLYSPTFVFHSQRPDEPNGFAGLRHRALVIAGALYDVSMSVRVLLDSEGTVVTSWRAIGVHKGDLLGCPATNRRVVVNGNTIFRVCDATVTEEWTEFDSTALLAQLEPSAVPVPAQRQPQRVAA